MAQAIAVINVATFPYGVDAQQSSAVLRGTITGLAGNTYTTSGVPANFAKLIDLQTGGAFVPPSQSLALNVYSLSVFSLATSTTLPGYTYQYDSVHQTLRMLSAATELANGATINVNEVVGWYAEFARI